MIRNWSKDLGMKPPSVTDIIKKMDKEAFRTYHPTNTSSRKINSKSDLQANTAPIKSAVKNQETSTEVKHSLLNGDNHPESSKTEPFDSGETLNVAHTMEIIPTIYGERHQPTALGSASGISASNLSLGNTSLALFKGVIKNLLTMFPKELLDYFGVERVLVTGSVVNQSQTLQHIIREMFGLPILLADVGDAAYGVTLMALDKE